MDSRHSQFNNESKEIDSYVADLQNKCQEIKESIYSQLSKYSTKPNRQTEIKDIWEEGYNKIQELIKSKQQNKDVYIFQRLIESAFNAIIKSLESYTYLKLEGFIFKNSLEYEVLGISPSAKYFIANCEYRGHFYTLVGCDNRDQPTLEKYSVLSAIGKNFNNIRCTNDLNFIFSYDSAIVKDEHIIKPIRERLCNNESQEKNIHYQAYEITLQQYSNYIESIKFATKPSYYIPLSMNGKTYAQHSKDPETSSILPPGKTSLLPENKAFTRISLNNSCLNACRVLIKEIEPTANIVSHALKTPPNTLTMQQGKITSDYLLIHPKLPEDKNSPAYELLRELQKSMDRLSVSTYSKELATEKHKAFNTLFDCLKDKTSLDKIKKAIENWKNQRNFGGNNMKLMSEFRDRYFHCRLFHWGKTSSHKTIEKLEKMCSPKL